MLTAKMRAGSAVEDPQEGAYAYPNDLARFVRESRGITHGMPTAWGTNRPKRRSFRSSRGRSRPANVFLPGHRIRLEVSSSNSPRYARETSTGSTIAGESPEEAVAATNRVLPGAGHPSRLILPIIDR